MSKSAATLKVLNEAFVPDERKGDIRVRLKRVRGQVDGIERMLDANRPCVEGAPGPRRWTVLFSTAAVMLWVWRFAPYLVQGR